GVGRSTLVVEREGEVRLASVAGGLEIHVGDERVVIDPSAPAAGLPDWLRLEHGEVARPGNLVTWSVDRVRGLSWFGDDGMQAVKQIAFTALDFVLRNKEQLTGDTGAEGIAADLGEDQLGPLTQEPV